MFNYIIVRKQKPFKSTDNCKICKNTIERPVV